MWSTGKMLDSISFSPCPNTQEHPGTGKVRVLPSWEQQKTNGWRCPSGFEQLFLGKGENWQLQGVQVIEYFCPGASMQIWGWVLSYCLIHLFKPLSVSPQSAPACCGAAGAVLPAAEEPDLPWASQVEVAPVLVWDRWKESIVTNLNVELWLAAFLGGF